MKLNPLIRNCFALISILASLPAFAFQYTVIDLGTLGGNFSSANAINNAGQVAGISAVTSSINPHATLWSNGSGADLGVLAGGSESYAYGINDNGQVAGFSYTAGVANGHATL